MIKNQEELVMYELPSISEYISIGWMRTIIARYCAFKIKRKMIRYKNRVDLDNFIKGIKEQQHREVIEVLRK